MHLKQKKTILWLVMAILLPLTACQAKDGRYYQLHPLKLQRALERCQAENTLSSECEKLQSIGLELNQLAYKLKSNPQAFGQKIIALQFEKTQLTEELNKQPDAKSSAQLSKVDNKLEQYLAIVKWLESPES